MQKQKLWRKEQISAASFSSDEIRSDPDLKNRRRGREGLHTHRDLYAFECMYVCMYVCMYLCMYVCMYVCTYVCTYVCMYVRMYVCMTIERCKSS